MTQIANNDEFALRGLLPSGVSSSAIGGRGPARGRGGGQERESFDVDDFERDTIDALAEEQDDVVSRQGERSGGALGLRRDGFGVGESTYNPYDSEREPPRFTGSFENQPNVSAGFASYAYRVQNEPVLSFGALGGNLDLIG